MHDTEDETVVEQDHSAFVDAISKRLTEIGMTPEGLENGLVKAELKAGANTYGIAVFVSADRVFYRDSEIDDEVERLGRNLMDVVYRQFTRKQYEWLQDIIQKHRGHDTYLFVIGPDSLTRQEQFPGLCWRIEMDDRAVKKVVCSMRDIEEVLSSPFNPVAHRASGSPKLYLTREEQMSFEDPHPDFNGLVTALYRPADFENMVKELEKRPNRNSVKRVAEKVFHRVMGCDYILTEGDAWPEIAHKGQDWSIPYFMASKGEQIALTFALFLALAHDNVAEGMCLGFKSTLNAMDLLRYTGALDCLRQFVLATGASLYIQTDKGEIRDFTDRKLSKAMTFATTEPWYA